MDETIYRALRHYDLSPVDIFRHHTTARARLLRAFLIYHLTRERRVPHRRVARRFRCSRTNILDLSARIAGNLEIHPGMRRAYLDFASAIDPARR